MCVQQRFWPACAFFDSQSCCVSSRGQCRFWSDWADAQADLTLHCAHKPEGTLYDCGPDELMDSNFCNCWQGTFCSVTKIMVIYWQLFHTWFKPDKGHREQNKWPYWKCLCFHMQTSSYRPSNLERSEIFILLILDYSICLARKIEYLDQTVLM